MTPSPDVHELAYQLVTGSARLVRLAAQGTNSPVPRALFRALSVINELGDPRISDIAEADRISQPTATTLVQKLEERQWAYRTPDPSDARAVRIAITPAGKQALGDYRDLAAQSLVPRLARLTGDDVEALARGVEALHKLLEKQKPLEDNE